MKIQITPLNEDLFQLTLEEKCIDYGQDFGRHLTRIYLLSLSREKLYRIDASFFLSFVETLIDERKKK